MPPCRVGRVRPVFFGTETGPGCPVCLALPLRPGWTRRCRNEYPERWSSREYPYLVRVNFIFMLNCPCSSFLFFYFYMFILFYFILFFWYLLFNLDRSSISGMSRIRVARPCWKGSSGCSSVNILKYVWLVRNFQDAEIRPQGCEVVTTYLWLNVLSWSLRVV